MRIVNCTLLGESLFLAFLLLLAGSGYAQELNQTDSKGRKQGEWILKKPDGTLIYEGRFVDDQPVGWFKRYYSDGTLKAEMLHRSPDEVYAKLYYEGRQPVLMAEGKYLAQEKDSVWLSYDPSGRLKSLDTYRSGIQEGRAVVYHENGAVSEETTYRNGERHGDWKQYYSSGKLMSEGTFKDGIRVGLYVKYYPNGKEWVHGKYENGFKESTWRYGNEDGSIGQMVVFRRGKEIKQVKQNGTFTEWYEPEKPRVVENYKNGKLHGPYIEYYNDGRWVEKQVDKRNKGGDIEIYRVLEGQTVALKAEYLNGVLHGTLEEYDESGRLLKKEVYENGELKK